MQSGALDAETIRYSSLYNEDLAPILGLAKKLEYV